MSTPLRTTEARTRGAHIRRQVSETATAGVSGLRWKADSSHGSGGVCSVVTTGTASVRAIATGRWCRELLCTTSTSSPPAPARSSIRER